MKIYVRVLVILQTELRKLHCCILATAAGTHACEIQDEWISFA